MLLTMALCAATSLSADTREEAEMRRLHKEVIVQAPLRDVWNAWTTNEGLRFISQESNVELRLGGPYEWFLELPPDEHGSRGGEGARVLAFLPREMLAFTWRFPPVVPELRLTGAETQVVVRFTDRGDGTVLVRLDAIGWQEGEAWESGYEYFDQAWAIVLERLKHELELRTSSRTERR